MKVALVLVGLLLVAVTGQFFPPEHYTQTQSNPFGIKTPEGEPPQLNGVWSFERWDAGVNVNDPPTYKGIATFTRRVTTRIVDQYRVTVEMSDANGDGAKLEGYVNMCRGTYMIDGAWVLSKGGVPVDAGYLIYLLQSRGPLHYMGDHKIRMMGKKGLDIITKLDKEAYIAYL